jgi:hypothetical protein
VALAICLGLALARREMGGMRPFVIGAFISLLGVIIFGVLAVNQFMSDFNF